MTFNEAWEYAKKADGWYSIDQSRALYDTAMKTGGLYVEVGTYHGRSAGILASAAKETGAHLICIDPVVGLAARHLMPFGEGITLMQYTSVNASFRVDEPINLLHIDGWHITEEYDEGPALDCYLWLPKVGSGGYACFHDYHTDWPDVIKAVDTFTAGWVDLGVHERLAIRRKP